MDGNTIATILTVVAAMGVPTGLLFGALIKSHERLVAILTDTIKLQAAQNDDLRNQLSRVMDVTEGQAKANETLTRTVRQRT